jgi:hypothetical protein
MQQIKRAGFVILVALIIFGCSTSRKRKTVADILVISPGEYGSVIDRVRDNNFADKGFIIKKGRITLEGTPVEGDFGFYAKMNDSGDLSLSVRGPLGIEVVRFLSVENNLAVIDRIGRTVYVGQRDDIMKRYGMPEDFMQILFGDLPVSEAGEVKMAENGLIAVYNNGEYVREVTICLQDLKVCKEYLFSLNSDNRVDLMFNNFKQTDRIKYASEITIEEKEKMFHVKLFIEDIIDGCDERIEFTIPEYRKKAL